MKSEVTIRDEENLLLRLCRLEFSDEQINKIRSLIAVVTDWNYFRNLANEHGVAALVWTNLEKYYNEILNPNLIKYASDAAMSEVLARTLEPLGDLFPSVSFMKNRYKCKNTWKVLLYYPHRIGKVLWLFRR
jgi:hypothetical protein